MSARRFAAKTAILAANTLFYIEIAARLGVSAANTLIFIGFAALEADSAAISLSTVIIRSLAQITVWLRKIGVFVEDEVNMSSCVEQAIPRTNHDF